MNDLETLIAASMNATDGDVCELLIRMAAREGAIMGGCLPFVDSVRLMKADIISMGDELLGQGKWRYSDWELEDVED